MDISALEYDLNKQGISVFVQAANPGLRYKIGIFWFLSEQECLNDILVVTLPDKNISCLRMAEGIVARHFPLYKLSRCENSLEAVFTRQRAP